MSSAGEKVFNNSIYPNFLELCKIKHPSNDEGELVEYIKSFAEKHNLRYDFDSIGNIAIYRDASPGLENAEPILFQGHIDMVCVPDKNIFPIKPKISDGWVHTDGASTLGADNGIAAAIMFELMLIPFDKNPPMEFLFTVAEEVGLVGASNIEKDKFNLKSKRIINIDSEDIDFITVGCAGAKDIDIVYEVTVIDTSAKNSFEIEIKGPGGHSGLVIHENIPNSIKIAAELLQELSGNSSVHLTAFSGGLARNAIPADVKMTIISDNLNSDALKMTADVIKSRHSDLQEFEVIINPAAANNKAFSADSFKGIMGIILDLPHGVIKLNEDTGGVLSSINLGVLELNDSELRIIMSSRSCEEKEIDEIIDSIKPLTDKYNGMKIEIKGGYPGWRPNMDSELLSVTENAFKKIRDKKPDYLDIHAGLECGILMNMFPTIKEAVSIGPNLHHAHSVKEKLEISSTIDIWNIIIEIIKQYSKV